MRGDRRLLESCLLYAKSWGLATSRQKLNPSGNISSGSQTACTVFVSNGWLTYLLAQEWQKKLSALKVAQLPWDPPPVKEQPAVPNSAKSIPPTLPSNGNALSPPPPQGPPPTIPSAPPIKNESNLTYPPQPQPPQNYPVPSFPQGQPMTARERAAQSLHESYGHRAGAQIAQLQSHQGRAPNQNPQSPAGAYIKQEDPQSALNGVQDYHGGVSQQPAAPIKSSQTDGAADARDDWAMEYARRKALARSHGSEGDRLMKSQFLARQRELEAGGLLSSLDEREMPSNALRQKIRNLQSQAVAPLASNLIRAQGDAAGDDDDDVDDEDAINSDLDDPDDLAGNDEEAENTDQVMLCTYDKVQRVKNKWKCTLKDGVLRVEGNE